MKRKAEDALLELGVTPNLKGFEYICKAVGFLQTHPNAKTGDVYVLVASEYGTSYAKVERSIRHSISKMDDSREAWRRYLGIKEKTNSAVLFTLAMKLRED